jgi:hypothetical protein
MADHHEELMYKLGKIEGGIDGINKRLDVANGRLTEHGKQIDHLEDFTATLKGKIAIISGFIALTTSLLTVWIRKTFFD